MNILTNKNAAKRNNILIILDNASSHKTGSVKEFIENEEHIQHLFQRILQN